MRYSELSRHLAGVSQKMLTQTLRNLERDGLLTRTVTPTVPVTVTYELTDLGLSLQQVMRASRRGRKPTWMRYSPTARATTAATRAAPTSRRPEPRRPPPWQVATGH